MEKFSTLGPVQFGSFYLYGGMECPIHFMFYKGDQMPMYELPKTKAEALRMVAENSFAPFDKSDWETFPGCESDNPLVCYLEDESLPEDDRDGIAIVIDGNELYFQTLNHLERRTGRNFQ